MVTPSPGFAKAPECPVRVSFPGLPSEFGRARGVIRILGKSLLTLEPQRRVCFLLLASPLGPPWVPDAGGSPVLTPLPGATRVPSRGNGSPRASGCPAEGRSRLAAFSAPFTF